MDVVRTNYGLRRQRVMIAPTAKHGRTRTGGGNVMTIRMRNDGRLWSPAVVAMLLALISSSLSAQAPELPILGDSTQAGVAATVALVEALPVQGAPAVILRRHTGGGGDVILMRTGADEAVMAAAIATLYSARGVLGDSSQSSLILGVRQDVVRRSWGRLARLQAADLLRRLREATSRPVQGVGRVRALEIRMRGHSGH